MAKFNPDAGLSPTNTPSGLGYSNGIGENNQFKTLFGGLSNAIGGFAQATDEANKHQIYEDTLASVDKVQSVFGVDAAANEASTTPADITKGGAQMSTLKKAYESGAISDVYYFTKLNDIVKGLRVKYPGYDEVIDNSIQNIAGVTPANAIVNAIRQDAMQGQNESKSREATFYQNHAGDIIRAHPDWKGPGDTRWSYDQLVVDAGGVQAYDSNVQAATARLSLDLATKKATDEQVFDTASTIAGTRVAEIVNGGLGGLGENFKATDAKLKGVLDGTIKLDGQTTADLTLGLNQARTQASLIIQRELSKPLNPDKPELGSIWSNLKTKSARDDVISGALAPIDIMQQAITNNDYGLVRAMSAVIEVQKNKDIADLLQSNDVFGKIQAMSSLMGPAFAPYLDDLFSKAPNLETAVTSMLYHALGTETTTDAKTGKVTPKVGAATVISDAERGVNKVTPAVVNTFMKTGLNVINSYTKGGDSKAADAVVRQLFDEKKGWTLEAFNEGERSTIFNQLVNPTTTAKLKQITDDSGDKTAWSTYTSWAYKNVSPVFTQQFNDLKNQMNDPVTQQLLQLRYDDVQGTVQFNEQDVGKLIASGALPPTGAIDPFRMYQSKTNGVIDIVSGINQTIGSMKSIFEADGKDLTKELTPFLNAVGIAPPPTAGGKAVGKQTSLSPMQTQQQAHSDVKAGIQLVADHLGTTIDDKTPGGQTITALATAGHKTPLEVASAYLGMHERKDTTAIANFIKTATGVSINPAETAWCAAWVNAVLGATGNEESKGNKLWAFDFESYGKDARKDPQPGDIVVFRWKDGGGHVGFVKSWNKDGSVQVLGGNQSNSVSVATYNQSQVSAVRRITPGTGGAPPEGFQDVGVTEVASKGKTAPFDHAPFQPGFDAESGHATFPIAAGFNALKPGYLGGPGDTVDTHKIDTPRTYTPTNNFGAGPLPDLPKDGFFSGVSNFFGSILSTNPVMAAESKKAGRAASDGEFVLGMFRRSLETNFTDPQEKDQAETASKSLFGVSLKELDPATIQQAYEKHPEKQADIQAFLEYIRRTIAAVPAMNNDKIIGSFDDLSHR